MRPHIRRLLESAGFSPRQLFAALQGAWLEPIVGSIWQENTGVTPTTTGGQTMGLMLDQSQGAVVGPDLVTNGGFSSNTDWVLGTDWSISGGLATKANTGTASDITQNIITTVGGLYRITFTVSGLTGANDIKFKYNGTYGPTYTANGTYTLCFFSTLSTNPVGARAFLSAASIDNISVRQILGNHAYQATAANRPTYQLDSNGLSLARHDTTDSLSVSLPDLGGGVFSASGSVYFATPVGMSALHGQSMGTAYTLPALSTDIYSWMVFPQRLSAVQENRLSRYFERKAGIAGPDYLLDNSDNQLTADDGEQLLLAQ